MKAVEILLNNGANVRLENDRGESGLSVAKDMNNREMIQTLKQHVWLREIEEDQEKEGPTSAKRKRTC